eukprot:TRINITY_DN5559_c0_g1_i6.p2 TRINITY_DN5559_c0_g1~~TRINITY_DN5559_c0_g1_i6.p2  ORF type:complete len:216 (-),score=52.26 TRINITY_DN5559_c0_g1_i6:340-987(-)
MKKKKKKKKDVFWYTKDKRQGGNSVQDEFKAVKAKEEELMMQALGLKPKGQNFANGGGKPKLEKHEMAQLLRKRSEELQEGQQEEDPDRVKGLGHAPGAIGGIEAREVLEGEGIDSINPAPINKQQLFAQQLLQRHSEVKEQLYKTNEVARPNKNKDKDRKRSKKSHKEKSKKKKRKRDSDSEDSLQIKRTKRRGGYDSDNSDSSKREKRHKRKH